MVFSVPTKHKAKQVHEMLNMDLCVNLTDINAFLSPEDVQDPENRRKIIGSPLTTISEEDAAQIEPEPELAAGAQAKGGS